MEPAVDLVSMYMDQLHPSDVGMAVAREHGVEVYPSIRAALTLTPPSAGHWPTAADWQVGDLAVDGVLIIAEHGDYSGNERSRQMYPRRYFFEQVCGVLATSGRAVPIFNDKHLAYSWADCVWMYERAEELGAPFMAGSSVPVAERRPGARARHRDPDRRGIVAGLLPSVRQWAGLLRLPRAGGATVHGGAA